MPLHLHEPQGSAPPAFDASRYLSPSVGAVRGQRLLRADLRNRLVPVAATGDRLDRGFAGRAAGHLHGRAVPGQPGLPRVRRGAPTCIRCGCTGWWSWGSAPAASWRCSACRWWTSVYAAAVGHGMPAILLRALVCALCLLPPTMLMGASLPAAARWLEPPREGVSWMGLALRRQHRRARCSAACWPASTCCACTI